MSLTDKSLKDKYGDLIAVDNSGNGIAGGANKKIEDGLGNESVLSIGTVSGVINLGSSGTFTVVDENSTTQLSVTSSGVTAQTAPMNTNQIVFNVENSGSVTAGTHYALSHGVVNSESLLSLGTGADPDTTHAASNTSINNFFYVHSAINIDSIHFFASTGASTDCTINMHLMSYAYSFANGDTATNGDFSSGVVVADHSPQLRFVHNDKINALAGTIQSASVAAGRILVATFENTTNTDSIYGKVVVNYHYI